MSYFECHNCNTKHEIFGNGGAKAEAEKLGVPFLNAIPLDVTLRTTSDEGNPVLHKEPKNSISKKYMEIGSKILNQIEKTKNKHLKLFNNLNYPSVMPITMFWNTINS